MITVQQKQHRKVKKLQSIDALRGIAILMVMLVHTSQVVSGLPSLTSQIADLGKLGVQLFFILSAYTLCLSASRRANEHNGLMLYYIRRFFRIAPLYYLGILLYGIFALATEADIHFTLENVLANILFVHGFYMPANNTIVPGGWSIGTEMAFYAVFPFLLYFYKQRFRHQLSMLLFPLAGLVTCLFATQFLLHISNYSLNENSFLFFNILNQLPVFLLGMAYYSYTGKYSGDQVKPLAFALPTMAYLLVVAGGFLLFPDNITLKPFTAGLIFLILLHAMRNYKWLNLPFLVRVGQLSYSMYIIHFVFAWYLSRSLATDLATFLAPHVVLAICYLTTILASATVAMVTERTIERYGIKTGQLIISIVKANKAPLARTRTGEA